MIPPYARPGDGCTQAQQAAGKAPKTLLNRHDQRQAIKALIGRPGRPISGREACIGIVGGLPHRFVLAQIWGSGMLDLASALSARYIRSSRPYPPASPARLCYCTVLQ